jgi:hypothetical protein
MAIHTLVYYGFFNTSFHRLVPGQDRCWKKDGSESPVELPPEQFDGIKFGFMQRSECYLIVQIDDLVLRAPILFVGGRHGPAAPGPVWSKLDDDVAMQLLADAMVANPEVWRVSPPSIRRVGSTSTASISRRCFCSHGCSNSHRCIPRPPSCRASAAGRSNASVCPPSVRSRPS